MIGNALKAIFGNLLGFDAIIMLLGVFNFWVLYRAYKAAQLLVTSLNTDGLCQADMRRDSSRSGKRLKDKDIIALRNKAESLYTWYINISAVFPLLGILGTVIALIAMQGEAVDSSANFMVALTSTFWGLIFSIVFKSLQTVIEAKLDEGVHEAERCLTINPDDDTEATENEET